MTFIILKYLHLLGFVYWLGGDLGTFLASRQVVRTDLSSEARQTALSILLACDLGPRLAMPMMLPLGVHMAGLLGYASFSFDIVVGCWILGVFWFSLVLIQHYWTKSPGWLPLLDRWLRRLVVIIGLVYGLSLINTSAEWLGWKLSIFALMVWCGLMVRNELTPFFPAYAKMVSEGPDQASDQTMMDSMSRCRRYVWCIWIGLFVNGALGVHLIG